MKKSKLLMLLPAFLLVGCAKTLTPEEGKAKAKEIAEKRAAEPLKVFGFEIKSTEKEGDKTDSNTISGELDVEKEYLHMNTGHDEHWLYKGQDSQYYVVDHENIGDAEHESKTYSVYSAELKAAFEAQFAASQSYAGMYVSVYASADLDKIRSEFLPASVTEEFKYSTKGEGQLTVEFEWSGEIEGVAGSIEMKGEWEDYLPQEFSLKTSAKDGSYSMEASVKFSYSVTPSYPNLEGYNKVN